MSDLFFNLMFGFGLFFGGLLFLVGLLLLLVGGLSFNDWLRSIRWQRVASRIESSEVVQERHFEGDIFFRIKLSYCYVFNADTYQGTRFAFSDRLHAHEAAARKVQQRYPVGMQVFCYVDPGDPTSAVLHRRGGLGGLLLGLFGGAMVGGVVFAALQAGLPAGWVQVGAGLLFVLFVLGALLNRLSKRRKERARAANLYPSPGKGTDEDVLSLVEPGERMLAIRLYRELHGTGLKDSRLAIDDLAEVLKRAEKRPETGSS